jgi:hypothetical protein
MCIGKNPEGLKYKTRKFSYRGLDVNIALLNLRKKNGMKIVEKIYGENLDLRESKLKMD